MATGQRKPSCPGWTAGACTYDGKPPTSSPPELAGTYGHIVIEDLDVAAMKRSMGRRAFRRSVSDAAMGLVKPQLAYKTARHGGVLTVADRWFASSQIHHGCHQPDGTPCRLISKGHIDKKLVCA